MVTQGYFGINVFVRYPAKPDIRYRTTGTRFSKTKTVSISAENERVPVSPLDERRERTTPDRKETCEMGREWIWTSVGRVRDLLTFIGGSSVHRGECRCPNCLCVGRWPCRWVVSRRSRSS